MAAEGPDGRILGLGPHFQPFRLGSGAIAMVHPSYVAPATVEPAWGQLLDLAEAMRDLAERATTAEGSPALADLVALAVQRVPRARWASLTVLRGKRFQTDATTDDRATKADLLQYDIGF